MMPFQISSLKVFEGRRVVIGAADGEQLRAKVISVLEPDGLLLVELIESTDPGRSERLGWPRSKREWSIPADSIMSIAEDPQ